MNNKKRSIRAIISLLLVVAMLISCIAIVMTGCGGDDEEDNKQPGDKPNEDNGNKDPDKDTDEDEPKDEGVDPNGQDEEHSKRY